MALFTTPDSMHSPAVPTKNPEQLYGVVRVEEELSEDKVRRLKQRLRDEPRLVAFVSGRITENAQAAVESILPKKVDVSDSESRIASQALINAAALQRAAATPEACWPGNISGPAVYWALARQYDTELSVARTGGHHG